MRSVDGGGTEVRFLRVRNKLVTTNYNDGTNHGGLANIHRLHGDIIVTRKLSPSEGDGGFIRFTRTATGRETHIFGSTDVPHQLPVVPEARLRTAEVLRILQTDSKVTTDMDHLLSSKERR